MLVKLSSQFILLLPVPSSSYSILEELLGGISLEWQRSGMQIDTLTSGDGWRLVEAVFQVMPDPPTLAIDTAKLTPMDVYRLFVADGNDPPIIQQLLAYESLNKVEPLKPGEPLTVRHLPFPSSGHQPMDQLASLMHSFGNGLGLELYRTLSPGEIDKLSYSLAELNRPEADRLKERLEELYKADVEAKAENPLDIIQRVMSQGQIIHKGKVPFKKKED